MAANGPIDPVRIYVLWHEECREGRKLAQAVYRWFRGSPDDLGEAGFGIPVHYRSKSSPGRTNGPLSIDRGASDITIVVPLVDEHMVTDGAWRRYLEALYPAAPKEQDFPIYPVVLHPAAYNLPDRLAGLNFIRLDRPSDASCDNRETVALQRSQRLLSLLTQACCRVLQAHAPGAPQAGVAAAMADEAGLPVRVFLSHAKVDGVEIAARLRDGLLHHGQLQVFFDESDLPFGHGYTQRLDDAASASVPHTSAMIAVYTDAYAGRPWCQRELRGARTPAKLDGEDGCRWYHKPLLVVDHLEGRRTRFLGEIGQAPVIRWNPQRVGETIDLLLREVLWSLYHRHWARHLHLPEGSHAFCGALDLHVAMQIRRNAGDALRRILVPPPGPATSERLWLTDLLDGVTVAGFDEMERRLP
jgi:hypothetical protein